MFLVVKNKYKLTLLLQIFCAADAARAAKKAFRCNKALTQVTLRFEEEAGQAGSSFTFVVFCGLFELTA